MGSSSSARCARFPHVRNAWTTLKFHRDFTTSQKFLKLSPHSNTAHPLAMAKTKPHDRNRKSKKAGKAANTSSALGKPKPSPEALLTQATALLHTSQPDDALVLARRALSLLQTTSSPSAATLPALNLLGEINVELGDTQAARESFLAAVAQDPEGVAEDGAEKFLWLAQLCEEGGAESVKWYGKGVDILRREIGKLEESKATSAVDAVNEKKLKMASALCGIVEVYMTDLS